MVWIKSNSSDDDIFSVVLKWIDVLSEGDYERVAKELGYWDFDDDSAAKAIRAAIRDYRWLNHFPNVNRSF